MDGITSIASSLSPEAAALVNDGTSQTSELTSDDFFQLLIAELTNQDPLEPMENQDLLNQITSIRDIEMSTSLTESLQSLTDQQKLSAVSSIIGQYVMSQPAEDGFSTQGIVVGIRFEEDNTALLTLADGTEVPMEDVVTIQSPDQAAQSFLGQNVTGVDRRLSEGAVPVQGQVTGVGLDEEGNVLLDLDGGATSVRLLDVISEIGAVGEAIAQVF